MLNVVYRLISPKRIEANFTDIKLDANSIIVRPRFLSICHADQRYFQGQRDINILKKKLPMALIHEAMGTVIYDPKGEFKPDERVILIPNIPFEKDNIVSENYLRSSKFRASSCDGFMQEYMKMDRDRLIRVSQEISDEMSSFTEIVSVCVHTILRLIIFHMTEEILLGYGVTEILDILLPPYLVNYIQIVDYVLWACMKRNWQHLHLRIRCFMLIVFQKI